MPILFGVNAIVARFKLFAVGMMIFLFTNKALATELWIFVSFSMPDVSLQQWGTQANKIGVPLLLRGLHEESMKKTVNKLQKLLGEHTQVMIDPERFKEFGIDKVPALVIAQGDKFDVIYGDQSLQSALWQVVMSGEFSEDALEYYHQLTGKVYD